jgi:hypothetical protein
MQGFIIMSIYSGFSTRNQENAYGKLCEDLVSVLAARVLKALQSESVDDTVFSKTIVSIYSKMGKLELHKYLPPKLSQCCTKLAVYCTSIYPFSQAESIESFPTPKIDRELPLIREEPKISRRRPIQSTLRPRNQITMSPMRAPSSSSYYEKVIEKFRSPIKNTKVFEGGTAESIQLNDGMFYRLM